MGKAKAVGIGCLVVILILGIVGYVVYRNAGNWLRSGGASIVVVAMEAILNDTPLPQAEKDSIMKPVEDLAADVKAGDVTFEQLASIGTTIAEGPIDDLVRMRAFELCYIEDSNVTDDEKAAARLVVGRYAHGIAQGSIETTADEIDEIISVTTTNDSGEEVTSLKDTLTPEEFKKCLAIMEKKADEVGIAQEQYQIDIGSAIQKAIDKGMAATPAE